VNANRHILHFTASAKESISTPNRKN